MLFYFVNKLSSHFEAIYQLRECEKDNEISTINVFLGRFCFFAKKINKRYNLF